MPVPPSPTAYTVPSVSKTSVMRGAPPGMRLARLVPVHADPLYWATVLPV